MADAGNRRFWALENIAIAVSPVKSAAGQTPLPDIALKAIDFPIPADLISWIERVSWIELAPGEALPVFAGARVHIGFVVAGSLTLYGAEHAWHIDQAVCLGAVTEAPRTAVAGSEGIECFLVKLAGGVAPGVIGESAESCRDQVLPLRAFWPEVLPIPANAPRKILLAGIFDQIRSAIALFQERLSWQPGQSRYAMQLLDTLSVEDAAEALSLSRPTFERHIRKLFGITPKKLSRIQRFYRALEVLSHPGCDVRSIELGYFDQSHMIAEFRHFTRLTPLGVLDMAASRPDSIQLYERFDEFAVSQAGSSRQR